MRGFMPSNEEQQVVDILRRPWQRSLVFTRGAEWDLSAICRRRWWRTGAGALVMSSQTLSWALPGVCIRHDAGLCAQPCSGLCVPPPLLLLCHG